MDSLPSCPVQGLWLSDYGNDSTTHQGNQMCLCTLVCKLTYKHIYTHVLSKHPACQFTSARTEWAGQKKCLHPHFFLIFFLPGIAPVLVQRKDSTSSHFYAGDVYMQHVPQQPHTWISSTQNIAGPLHTGPIQKWEKKHNFFFTSKFHPVPEKTPKKALPKPISF